MANPTETPERELELIRLAVGWAGRVEAKPDGYVLWNWAPGFKLPLHLDSTLRRRLVELGRHEEQRTQDAETRRALEEA